MAVHVAILLKPYIRKILDGTKTIESRLTRGSRVPYQAIQPGQRIYFKASSGPYMATAVADRVEFFADMTRDDVDRLQAQYNNAICGDDTYWNYKRNSRYGTLVWLRDVQPTSTGPAMEPSRGPAWFVLEEQSMRAPLTGGAIRNRYVRAPEAMRAVKGEIELHLPDGETVSTDIRKDHLIRWRGWGALFAASQAKAGDAVVFEPLDRHRFRVHIESQAAGGTTAPVLSTYISTSRLQQLVRQAKAEDLGPSKRDLTSQCFAPATRTTAVCRARQSGVLCGGALLAAVAGEYDSSIKVNVHMADGQSIKPGETIAEISGSLRSVLMMERVALNFMTHLSGIATHTAQYVAAVQGSKARIYDTRKTIPGLRGLAKYAVKCGGGESHRIGLYDAVLVKDNHIAHIATQQLAASLSTAIAKARRATPAPSFIEIEIDTLQQLKRVLKCDVDIILLDNMKPPELRQAVKLRDQSAPRVQLEASGGVTLANVKKIAATGVDRIAVGAITHSAPALDIGLDIDP